MKEYDDPCDALLARWLTSMIYLWTRDMEAPVNEETEEYVAQQLTALDGMYDQVEVIYSDPDRKAMAERLIARIGL